MNIIARICLIAAGLSCSIFLSAQHISDFVSVSPGPQTTDLIIPSNHTFQYLVEHGDILGDGSAIPDRFDYTGFRPFDCRSDSGWIVINSELPVGNVSVLDVYLDTATRAWIITDSGGIDFSSIGGTGRNCGGAIMDNGHVITCEEMEVNTDNNSDGYDDRGWCIEIDPVNREVVEVLHSMGQMKHENVALHPNDRTVYLGADSNPGYVYKFVADVAGDYSSGVLSVFMGDKEGEALWVVLDNSEPEGVNTTLEQCAVIQATNFLGVEDVELRSDGHIYVAVKWEGRTYAMHDVDPLDTTGVVYSQTFVGAASYTFETETGPATWPWGVGNDNMAFDSEDNLWVLQDGSDDMIWVVDKNHTPDEPKVRLFGRSPAGSEPTGITFSPDNRYLFMSFQNPNASNNVTSQPDAFGALQSFDKDVAVVIALDEWLGPDDSISSAAIASLMQFLCYYGQNCVCDFDMDSSGFVDTNDLLLLLESLF